MPHRFPVVVGKRCGIRPRDLLQLTTNARTRPWFSYLQLLEAKIGTAFKDNTDSYLATEYDAGPPPSIAVQQIRLLVGIEECLKSRLSRRLVGDGFAA